ncbi:MAG: hypothetical protein QOI57_2658 [Rubrobacteraceae bacterium]|nr:hypothetical protein [Rubrobacteraceae bacterium]
MNSHDSLMPHLRSDATLPYEKGINVVGQRKEAQDVKMALDYWYELWANSGRKDGPSLETQHSEEEDRYYPWEEDYPACMRDKEVSSDSR